MRKTLFTGTCQSFPGCYIPPGVTLCYGDSEVKSSVEIMNDIQECICEKQNTQCLEIQALNSKGYTATFSPASSSRSLY